MLDDSIENNMPADKTNITASREFGRDPVYMLVSICIWLFIAFQVFGIAWYWFLPDFFHEFGQPPVISFENVTRVEELSLLQRSLCALVGYVVAMILIWGLLLLRQVAHKFARSDFFSPHTEKLTRRAGYLMIIYMPASTLRGALISVISSWQNPVGERLLDITITNWDLASIITGLILLLFARAIAHARGQKEELSQIV